MDIREELLQELCGDILPFWTDRMTDPRGGYYGRITGAGEVEQDACKGAILCSRILWTFSSAYRILGREDCLIAAERARNYILDRFLDPEYGGVFWSVSAEGAPLDTKKQFYAIAFAIYGLAEFHRATADPGSLLAAQMLLRSIEDHSRDPLKGGYLEACTRDWKPIGDMRLSEKDRNDAKTMNTHLHILEGYTALYRVWKTEELADALRELILTFLDRIVQPDGHLGLFFNEDWVLQDSTRSFGHDIEASWLLAEAAEVLGDEALLERVRTVCTRIAVAAMEGFSPENGMIYEHDPATGRTDSDRHWWVQAETVVGCWNQYRSGGGQIWKKAAESEWEFIRRNLLCPDGEWYWALKADGTPDTSNDRAGFWKCPYHNGRMCMELLQRI